MLDTKSIKLRIGLKTEYTGEDEKELKRGRMIMFWDLSTFSWIIVTPAGD